VAPASAEVNMCDGEWHISYTPYAWQVSDLEQPFKWLLIRGVEFPLLAGLRQCCHQFACRIPDIQPR
jgi:hypothetical protein